MKFHNHCFFEKNAYLCIFIDFYIKQNILNDFGK